MQGNEVCALEQEISREARIAAAGIVTPEEREDAEKAGRLPGEGEDFQIPLVLMTLGWDPAGDPTHQAEAEGRDLSCVYRILKVKRIKTWFTSHTRYDSRTDDKVLEKKGNTAYKGGVRSAQLLWGYCIIAVRSK